MTIIAYDGSRCYRPGVLCVSIHRSSLFSMAGRGGDLDDLLDSYVRVGSSFVFVQMDIVGKDMCFFEKKARKPFR